MRTLVPSLLIVFYGTVSFAKTYVWKHDVVMLAYNESSCLEDKGEWVEDEYCVFHGAEDTVTITRSHHHGPYKVEIETIATNAHMCSYEATNGRFITKNSLVSSVPSTFYNEEGSPKSVQCDVTVTFNKDKSVTTTINNREYCQEFCGANVSLEIEKAVLKN